MRKKYNLNLTKIGERLRGVREALHYTLEKMQEVTGFSKSLISAAEKGMKKPSAIYLFALLDRFGVNLNYVFNGKGAMFMPGAEPEGAKSDLDDNSGRKWKKIVRKREILK
jgi:transcriptional regulator with XRE-family HTH domain